MESNAKSYILTREQFLESLVRGMRDLDIIAIEDFDEAIRAIGVQNYDAVGLYEHANGYSLDVGPGQAPDPLRTQSSSAVQAMSHSELESTKAKPPVKAKARGPKATLPEDVKALLVQVMPNAPLITTIRKWSPGQLLEAKRWAKKCVEGHTAPRPEFIHGRGEKIETKPEAPKPHARKRHSQPPPGAELNGHSKAAEPQAQAEASPS